MQETVPFALCPASPDGNISCNFRTAIQARESALARHHLSVCNSKRLCGSGVSAGGWEPSRPRRRGVRWNPGLSDGVMRSPLLTPSHWVGLGLRVRIQSTANTAANSGFVQGPRCPSMSSSWSCPSGSAGSRRRRLGTDPREPGPPRGRAVTRQDVLRFLALPRGGGGGAFLAGKPSPGAPREACGH